MDQEKAQEDNKKPAGSRRVPMKVLVLGLSRTGTSSIQKALQQLGYPKVYHTRTMLVDRPNDGSIWEELMERKFKENKPISKEEWDRLLGDFDAVTDVPCAIFWRELIDAYPDAKIILTVRDSTEAWFKSYSSTIGYLTSHHNDFSHRLLRYPPFSWVLGPKLSPFDRQILQQIKYTPRGNYKEDGRRWYEEHNQAVKSYVPADKLLVFNAREGWEPLCQFLGKPMPVDQFPRVFTKDEYLELVKPQMKVHNGEILRKLVGFSVASAAIYIGVKSVLSSKSIM